MLLLFAMNEEIKSIALIVLGIIVGVGILAVGIIRLINTRKAMAEEKAACKKAVAQAVQKALTELHKDYLVLAHGTTYVVGVGPNSQISSGKYQLKNAGSTGDHFNILLNGQLVQYHDGDVAVFMGGDEICPESEAVLIRPYSPEVPEQN